MQEKNVPSHPLSGNLEPLVQMFNSVSNAIMKSVSRKASSQLIGLAHDEEFPANSGENDSVTANIQGKRSF